MLTKAILTGGLLSVLAGSIVYFGTEGADALEFDMPGNVIAEETELAGAVNEVPQEEKPLSKKQERAQAKASAKKLGSDANGKTTQIAAADPIDPPAEQAKEKPKTKWLDQYLKSTKSKKADSEKGGSKEAMEPNLEEGTNDAEEVSVETDAVEGFDGLLDWVDGDEAGGDVKSLAIDVHEDGSIRYTDGTLVEDEADLMHAKAALKAIGELDDAEEEMSDSASEKKKLIIKMKKRDGSKLKMDAEEAEIERIETLMRDRKDSRKKVRTMRIEKEIAKKRNVARDERKAVDYDFVLEEARKLQVLEMRNIAMFEIIDYAVDRRDFGQAADIVSELSDPELRDTARAKIGVGLAKVGDGEAAFAVLDEMEIDELTAAMRLEIITALVATKAERSVAPVMR